MRTLFLTASLVLVISGCSSTDESDPGSNINLEDPLDVAALDSTPDTETETETETNASVITVDNHITVLANVFAIFSGKLYGDEVLTAPDFSVAPLDSYPDFDNSINQLISEAVDLVCTNGGTVSAVPETEGTDTRLGWNYNFENCQDGIALLHGQITNSIFEAIFITSEEFVRDEQTKVVSFSGSIAGRSAASGFDASFWDADDFNFKLEKSEGNALTIEDATSSYLPYEIELRGRAFFNVPDATFSGEFKVISEWTNNEQIFIRIIEGSEPGSDIGLLEITAGPDNVLLVDADTGDANTISITITADGISTTLLQPWTLWSSDLVFNSASGF